MKHEDDNDKGLSHLISITKRRKEKRIHGGRYSVSRLEVGCFLHRTTRFSLHLNSFVVKYIQFCSERHQCGCILELLFPVTKLLSCTRPDTQNKAA